MCALIKAGMIVISDWLARCVFAGKLVSVGSTVVTVEEGALGESNMAVLGYSSVSICCVWCLVCSCACTY